MVFLRSTSRVARKAFQYIGVRRFNEAEFGEYEILPQLMGLECKIVSYKHMPFDRPFKYATDVAKFFNMAGIDYSIGESIAFRFYGVNRNTKEIKFHVGEPSINWYLLKLLIENTPLLCMNKEGRYLNYEDTVEFVAKEHVFLSQYLDFPINLHFIGDGKDDDFVCITRNTGVGMKYIDETHGYKIMDINYLIVDTLLNMNINDFNDLKNLIEKNMNIICWKTIRDTLYKLVPDEHKAVQIYYEFKRHFVLKK